MSVSVGEVVLNESEIRQKGVVLAQMTDQLARSRSSELNEGSEVNEAVCELRDCFVAVVLSIEPAMCKCVRKV